MKTLSPVLSTIIFILALALSACDGGGSSDGVRTAPSAPVVTAASGQITITWSAVAGADSYQVWYGTTDDSSLAGQYGGDFSGTACLLTYLTNNTVYYVWIKARYGTELSGFSPSGSATPTSSSLAKSDVVFVYYTSSSDSAIQRMQDSGSPVNIVSSTIGIELVLPSASTNRDKAAYLYFETSDPFNTFIMYKDSGGTLDITPSNFNYWGDFSMALSPDGSKLVYSVYGSPYLYIIPTDSTNPSSVQLTNCTGGKDNYPTWSPDGTQIAFVHIDDDYNAKIYRINADGSSTDPYADELFSFDTIVPGNESLIQITWSPVNPYQMACSSRLDGSNPKFFIYTLNLTTKERMKVTNTTGTSEFNPRWSKDGNFIFYEINKNIYYTPINDLEASQITTDGKSSFRGWEPS